MLMMLMDETRAQELITATAGQGAQLEPRFVDAGPYAGQYALPSRLKTNVTFQTQWPLMAGLPDVEVNINEAWPPEDES